MAHLISGDAGQGALHLVGDQLHGDAQFPLLHALAPGLPQPQQILAEITVQLVAEGHAQGRGGDQGPIGGHRLRILLMKLLRRKRLHGAPTPF